MQAKLTLVDRRERDDHPVDRTLEFTVHVEIDGPPGAPGVVGRVSVRQNQHGEFPDTEQIHAMLPGDHNQSERAMLVTMLKDFAKEAAKESEIDED